jgi:hypothetical protein
MFVLTPEQSQQKLSSGLAFLTNYFPLSFLNLLDYLSLLIYKKLVSFHEIIYISFQLIA